MLVWSQQVKQADTEFTTVSAEDIEKFIVGTVDPDTSQEVPLYDLALTNSAVLDGFTQPRPRPDS